MKRVWCLYRVSTKKQVQDDDLPVQRAACQRFIAEKANWCLTRELYEKGVSGLRKERDAVSVLLEAARARSFDVLVVFMFDRLGRRDDETPLVVRALNDCGVEVWSTQEGQRETASSIDKLLTYISFWQASVESEKISLRVKEAKQQQSARGYFQGGVVPFGYRLVETGEVHWRHRQPVRELVICEEERIVVARLFDLYTEEGLGYRAIAKQLAAEGMTTRSGKPFSVSTVKRMLANPIYIGRKRYNDGWQPYRADLRIVSNAQFKKIKNNEFTEYFDKIEWEEEGD